MELKPYVFQSFGEVTAAWKHLQYVLQQLRVSLKAGTNITLTNDPVTGATTISSSGGGGGVSDGDKGDIVVSGSGTVYSIDAKSVTYPKIQDVSATDKLLGRSSPGAGVLEEIPCTAAGRAILDDADASAQRTTLGFYTGSATVTIPSPVIEYEEDISVSGIVPTMKVLIGLGVHADDDENDPELLDLVTLIGIAGTNKITARATFSELTSGPVKLNYLAV